MRRVFSLLVPLLLLLVGIGLFCFQTPETTTPVPPAALSETPQPVRDSALEAWIDNHRGRQEISPEALEKAVTMAKARKERMLQWMRVDPEQALEQSISLAKFESLPEQLQPWFERPFVTMATLRVLPVCSEEATVEPMKILEMDGANWDAAVFGWRQHQVTKENTPLAGITLDGLAAISEDVFTVVAADEATTFASLPLGNQDAARDFSTGAPLGTQPVTALAAGKRYLFSNQASLEDTNRRMAELDASVSPTTGSNLVFAPSPGDGAAVDWNGLQEEVELQASAWSETPKSVFCIRVDFSDVPGEAVSQTALANVMNTAVKESIGEMSYGKTNITAGVSATTVRMPQPASYYAPSNNSGLHTDAKNAYLAAAGPTALDGYDIVVVHFASIGMQGSGVTYAGLAGGGNQWLQGTYDSGVIIHEFGHNYGIGHASFWSTSDGSVAGTGSTVEYGDPTDIMGSGPDPEGHFHMQAKQRLGWLDASGWQDASATGSGIRRIYRFDSETTTGALRGLRITKASVPEEYYWVGYRPGITGFPAYQQGAYLIWQRPGQTRSWLLDATPGSADGKSDAPVSLGRTYSDPVAGVHVTPLGIGGTGGNQWLDVNVQLGSFPGNQAPTASVTGSGAVNARTETAYSASASDGNGDTLAYHWDFGDGSPGTIDSSVNHRWTVGGSYTVTLTVSDMKGGSVVSTLPVTVADPLASWTAGSVGASRTVDRSAYLNGRFIVTGNQYAYMSFDGLSWREKYLALNFRSGGTAYGSGSYVIAGHDYVNGAWQAAVFRSVDGIQWIRPALAQLPELRDVAWGAGAFVAVGDDGTILRSTNGGQNWTAISAPGLASLESIAYGGGGFVAVGGTAVYTSPDGQSWTDRSSGHSLESWHSFKSVAFANGSFIAGGWYSGMHVSQDGGVTWTEASIRGDHDYEIQEILSGEGCITASAIDKDDADASTLLVSIDGWSWVESGYTAFPNTEGLAFGNGRFVSAHGSAGATLRSGSFHPANGNPSASISAPAAANARTSVLFTANASDPNGDPLILVWDFKDGTPLVTGGAASHVFPVGGSFSVDLIATDTRGGVTVSTHAIVVSDPLNDWTTRTSGTTAHLNDIVAGGGKLVAVGESSGTYRTSTDGVNWSGGTIGVNIYLNAITHDGTNFIAVGQDYDFAAPAGWKGTIYTSPNGTSWTRRHYSGATLRDVASGGGVLVAVGDGGVMWRSTTGTSWSPVSSGVTENLGGVAHGNGGFVAVGSASNGGSGVTLKSSDGSSWSNTSGGTGLASWQGFYDVDYCSDRFLASGWYSKIRHSTNDGSTFATNETATRQIAGFAHGNGIYLAAGIDKDNADADINLISIDGANWTPLTTASQSDRRGLVFYNNTFITVGRDGSIRQSATFTAPAASGYSAWQMVHFPEAPPLSGAGADFDFDGVANLVEYVTGTDPRNAGDRVNLTGVVEGGQLVLSIDRDPAVTDVTISAEKSTDLSGWSGAGVTVLEDSSTRFKAAIPLGASSSFLRAVITAN